MTELASTILTMYIRFIDRTILEELAEFPRCRCELCGRGKRGGAFGQITLATPGGNKGFNNAFARLRLLCDSAFNSRAPPIGFQACICGCVFSHRFMMRLALLPHGFWTLWKVLFQSGWRALGMCRVIPCMADILPHCWQKAISHLWTVVASPYFDTSEVGMRARLVRNALFPKQRRHVPQLNRVLWIGSWKDTLAVQARSSALLVTKPVFDLRRCVVGGPLSKKRL